MMKSYHFIQHEQMPSFFEVMEATRSSDTQTEEQMSDFIGYIEALALRSLQRAEAQFRAPAAADPAFNTGCARRLPGRMRRRPSSPSGGRRDLRDGLPRSPNSTGLLRALASLPMRLRRAARF